MNVGGFADQDFPDQKRVAGEGEVRHRRPWITIASSLGIAALILTFSWQHVSHASPAQTGATAYSPTELAVAMQSALKDGLAAKGISIDRTKFMAGDSTFASLDSQDYDKAAFMYADASNGNHTWRLYIGGSVDGAPPTKCPDNDPSTMYCSISDNADGSVSDTRTIVAEYNSDISNWQQVDWKTLSDQELKNARIETDWTVWRSGHKTTVVETVFGPSSLTQRDTFLTTSDDWKAVLSDERLEL